MSILSELQKLASRQDPAKEFSEVANKIINHYELVINQTCFDFTALEFYVYDSKIHPDPFVHRADKQLSLGYWYFHNSGFDVTCGDGKRRYGGILLRGIQTRNSGKEKAGPWLAAEKIFSSLTMVDRNPDQFLMRPKHSNSFRKIITAKRINLQVPKIIDNEIYLREIEHMPLEKELFKDNYDERKDSLKWHFNNHSSNHSDRKSIKKRLLEEVTLFREYVNKRYLFFVNEESQ